MERTMIKDSRLVGPCKPLHSSGMSAGGERHALMVSYFFPPLGGSGVYRALKFCKYLPAWGWKPVVLSAHDPRHELRDESLLQDLPPGTAVYRSYSDVAWHTRLCDWLDRRRLLWRLSLPIRSRLAFPDDKKGWAQRAYRQGLDIIRSRGAEVVYTTSHPFAAHVVGLRLKRATGVPWVADFRDPWSDGPMHRAGLADRVLARHFRLEHTVATLADHLTFAHPAIAQSFRRRHNLPASKVSCITNGFDPDDFRGWQHATSERERVSVVHLGTFYGAYNPSPLKRALLLAQERCPRLIEQLKLVFVGGTPVRFDDIPGLAVEVTERVSHQEALRRLRDADVTLNVYERLVGEHNISGKLFEYLAAGRPILAIVPEDGATAEIVAACNAGFVADPDKPEEVLVAIQRCIDAARGRAPFCPDRAEIEKFSRYRLAGQLAATFARVETARAGE